MKFLAQNLIIALFFTITLAVDAVRRQDDSPTPTDAPGTTITGDMQGNGPSAVVSINSGNGNGDGNTDTTTTIDSGSGSGSGQTTSIASSSSSGLAMGMMPDPTTMPLVAGGMLVAANVLFL